MARTLGAYNTATRAPRLQQVWQSMRILRGRFSAADLLTTADSGESAVHKYCRALCQAGYLRVVQTNESGRTGSRIVYALVRDSGPTAPIRRADGSGVYDPNTNTAWGLDGKPIVERQTPVAAPVPESLYPLAGVDTVVQRNAFARFLFQPKAPVVERDPADGGTHE